MKTDMWTVEYTNQVRYQVQYFNFSSDMFSIISNNDTCGMYLVS